MRQLVQRVFLCLGFLPEWEFDRFRAQAHAGLNALQEAMDCLNDRQHELEARMAEFDVKGAKVK